MKIVFRNILAAVAAGILLTGQSMAAESDECGKIRRGDMEGCKRRHNKRPRRVCVIFAEGKYYWYGEHRAAVRSLPQEGGDSLFFS